MSEFFDTPEKHWGKLYERRFLELAYRVMSKCKVKNVIIDSYPYQNPPVKVTESAFGQTILLELRECTEIENKTTALNGSSQADESAYTQLEAKYELLKEEAEKYHIQLLDCKRNWSEMKRQRDVLSDELSKLLKSKTVSFHIPSATMENEFSRHYRHGVEHGIGKAEQKYAVLLIAAKRTLTDNLHLCDGDTCTLFDLRMAVKDVAPEWDLFGEESV